ncbi:hypothetical protein MNV49_007749 [Pseudohyphozyma bogoriensis]|nr:hypothetical protein MNV49_007749 [Pseudohyphozyma bogoriensis]
MPVSEFIPSGATLKARTTSIKSWELPKEESAFAPEGTWSNHDSESRVAGVAFGREAWSWTTVTFALYWCADLITAGTWTGVASLYSLGLNWWEALLCIFSGGLFLCFVISMNGVIGARLHTPFAVSCRAAYGTYFSKFCVLSRMVIAWFWFSIQTYSGGLGMTQFLTALWPSYANIPNHLPESAGVTTQGFLSFFLFWAMQFPFILVHPRKLRPIFLAKNIILPIVAIGTLAWSIHAVGYKAAAAALRTPSTLHGAAGYRAFLTGATSQAGQWVTLACNIGDFSRYAKKPSSAGTQMAIIPFLWTFTSLFGAISTQCTTALYGELLLTPFAVIAKWQGSHVGRFFAAVCSLAWILGNIGLNITANSISASNDCCTLVPKYINLFRGQMISVTVGVFAFAPWKVMASGAAVVSFASAYAVVLAPMMMADFFWVKNEKYDVPQLYDMHGIYYYTWGTNWRAVVALCLAVVPNIPGMGYALNSHFNIGGLKNLWACSVFYAIIVSAASHVILSKIFPHRGTLIAECVYAHEVLEARAARGSEHGEVSSEKDKEVAQAYAVEV